MTVNIVVFIDCYSTIYIENNMAFITYIFSKKNKRRMSILGALYFLGFLAGKLRHFERSFEKFKKKQLAHAYFKRFVFFLRKFFGGKIKNFEQGFGEQKI